MKFFFQQIMISNNILLILKIIFKDKYNQYKINLNIISKFIIFKIR